MTAVDVRASYAVSRLQICMISTFGMEFHYPMLFIQLELTYCVVLLFEVLTAASCYNLVSLDMTPFNLVDKDRRFGVRCQLISLKFGYSRPHPFVDSYMPNHTVSCSRRQ